MVRLVVFSQRGGNKLIFDAATEVIPSVTRRSERDRQFEGELFQPVRDAAELSISGDPQFKVPP